MKIKYFLLSVAVAVATLSSCNKTLDSAPDGKITYDAIFADNDKTGAFLNTCYANIPHCGYRYYFWTNWWVGSSDECFDNDADSDGSGMVNNNMYNGNISPGEGGIGNIINGGSPGVGDGTPLSYWEAYWNSIWNCSYFISRIDRANVKNPTDRARWKAEAHVLRAYYYMLLFRIYGPNLPIEDEPYNMAGDFSGMRPASVTDLAKFVFSECDSAINSEALPWRITTEAEKQRVTKAVAWAIKSRFAVYAASPLFNQGNDMWEEAYQITKNAYNAIKGAGYELYKTSKISEYTNDQALITPEGYPAAQAAAAAALNEYFCEWHDYGGGRDLETIWEDRNGNGQVYHIGGIGMQEGYKAGPVPTQEMADAYPTNKGHWILDLGKPYLNIEHTQPNVTADAKADGYSESDPYSCYRDPRFYASIYYHGSKRYTRWSFEEDGYAPNTFRTRVINCSEEDPWTGEDIKAATSNKRQRSRTGYYSRKYLNPTKNPTSPRNDAPGFKHFRLAEVILNYAEAAAEAGHTADALEALKEIRDRVAMPQITTTDQTQLIREVHAERRIEMYFEEQRFFDMRRWQKPDGDLAELCHYTTAMQINKQPNGTYTYKRVKIREMGYACYTNKFLILPMPLAEASRLKAITGMDWQSPGW